MRHPRRRPIFGICPWLWLCGCLATTAAAQPLFAPVAKAQGMPVVPLLQSRSYAFADVDNDGWPDQYRLEGLGSFRVVLLHNEAGGRFVDYAHRVDPGDLPVFFRGGGGAAADVDNDGDLTSSSPTAPSGTSRWPSCATACCATTAAASSRSASRRA